MSDNVGIRDGSAAAVTIGAKDVGGVLFPIHLIGDPTTGVPISQASVLTADPASGAAGVTVRQTPSEVHLGAVGTIGDVIEITLTTDTSIYADGDVLADTQTVANAARVSGGLVTLQSIVILDKADQGIGLDLIFLRSNTSMGTENIAPNISDANAENIIGRIPINASAFYDIGGCKIASFAGIGLKMKAVGSRDLYIAAISRGTGTYAGATDIMVKLGFDQD